jgi:rhamnosyl/mannosyltransferase
MPLSPAQVRRVTGIESDIAHIHSPYPLGELANWLLGRSRATVITYHSDIVRQKRALRLYGPLLRRVLRTADAIIATSTRYVETSPWLRPLQDRVTVVPLGVDLSRFVNRRSKARPGVPRILFVGRLRYYKGLDTLLRALPSLPDVELEVVGDGPMGPVWQNLARSLGLQSRVRFVGEVSDDALIEHYESADVFVLPANARSEAFGSVLLEAMASGLPVVSTEIGTATSWVNRDGETGRVVPAKDPRALADALDSLLRDGAARERMGRAGRARVETHFSHTKMLQGVSAVYEDALERARSGERRRFAFSR